VYAQDGSFTGTLDTEVGGSNRIFNLGSDADIAAGDTEYLETSWDTNECVIRPKYTGSGTFRGLKLQAALANRGFLNINSTGSIALGYNTTNNFTVQSGETRFGADIFPATSNTHTLGEDARRWSNVASIDGSFSGNLINEVGGSYKLYNLGAEGDADTEYLETAFVFGKPTIQSLSTGSGVARDLMVGTPTGARLEVRPGSNQAFLYSSATNVIGVTSSGISLTGTAYPATNDTTTLGTSSLRFSNIYSVDGNFSGDVSAAAFTSTVGNAVASFAAQDPASSYPRALFKIGSLTSITNVGINIAPDVSGTDQRTSQIAVLTNPTDTSSSRKGAYLRATSTAADLIAGYGNGTLSDIPLRFLPNGLNNAPTLTLFENDATFDCNVSVDGNLDTE
jgi:hypothetical protein